jgi:plastocyanin
VPRASIAFLVLLTLAACGDDDVSSTATTSSVPASEPASESESVTVDIVEFAFDPSTLEVASGDSVVFTNGDGFAHTAQADDGSFDTGEIAAGASADAVTFEEPGAFRFFCGIHNYMTGTITVT